MKNSIFIILILFWPFFTAEAQTIDPSFFTQVDQLFKSHVQDGAIDYSAIQQDPDFPLIIKTIEETDWQRLPANSQQAFLINSYNLLVIHQVIETGVSNSVQEAGGFFDARIHIVGGEKMSLNTLEKKHLLATYGDPRFHFVLVCGAQGCPPITNFAYIAEQLDQQLDQQTQKAINDPLFIQVGVPAKKVSLSQIFSWYGADFGGSKKSILAFINQYKEDPIPEDFGVKYYNYDWTLNAQRLVHNAATVSNSSNRYVVSAAIPKGTTETKIFNNLYTQRTRNGSDGNFNARSNFLTTSVSFLYGITNRFNFGFDLRYRRVSNTDGNTSPLNVFTNNAESRRQGFTNVGPKIRWAPFDKLPNFSVQSALWIPIGQDLEGNATQPYIDWSGTSWNTQFFNDITLNSHWTVFTEIDVLIEDIGNVAAGALNRFSTPATVIFSYFPNPKTTIYALGNYSPFWGNEFDYFVQAGLGAKYQVTPKFELEALVTDFSNKFLANNNGQAATFNLGIRISR